MEKPGDGLAMVFKGERDGRYRRKDAFVFHCRDHSLHTVDSTAIFEQLEKYSDGMHKFSAQSRGVGYLDENGKIAIAAQYYDGSDFSNGTAMAVIHEGGGKFRHPQIDKLGREIAAQSPLIGEQSEQEKKVERIKSRTLADFRPFDKMNSPWVYVYKTEKDRFIEHTLEERKHFDSYAWKQKCSPDRNRKEMFGDFLQDYRLIGMSRRQVVDLLGPADVGGYQTKEDYLRYQMEPIQSESCTQQSTTSIRIVFNTEDRVDYWYYTNGFAKTPSVKKDILLAPATYLYPMFAPGEISAVPEL